MGFGLGVMRVPGWMADVDINTAPSIYLRLGNRDGPTVRGPLAPAL